MAIIMNFKEISPLELEENFIKQISREWTLVSAAKNDAAEGDPCGVSYNTMTASWGGVGFIWNKPAAFVYIRPQRHTFSFIEDSDYMTLSFFGGEMKDALNFCGKYSGRDFDKAKECSLTPVFTEEENGAKSVYFAEASKVLVLKKMYAAEFEADKFIDKSCLDCYKAGDFHKAYTCEIIRALVK